MTQQVVASKESAHDILCKLAFILATVKPTAEMRRYLEISPYKHLADQAGRSLFRRAFWHVTESLGTTGSHSGWAAVEATSAIAGTCSYYKFPECNDIDGDPAAVLNAMLVQGRLDECGRDVWEVDKGSDAKNPRQSKREWAEAHKANLRGARLILASLGEAHLDGADLSGANLWKADIHSANLSGADLSKTMLLGAILSKANLSRANLSEANLWKADLSGADLSKALLCGANLAGTDLSRADFSEADLSNVTRSRPTMIRDAYVHSIENNDKFKNWALKNGASKLTVHDEWLEWKEAGFPKDETAGTDRDP